LVQHVLRRQLGRRAEAVPTFFFATLLRDNKKETDGNETEETDGSAHSN
jgi:hypothetical protein